jgi:hypothetical protein
MAETRSAILIPSIPARFARFFVRRQVGATKTPVEAEDSDDDSSSDEEEFEVVTAPNGAFKARKAGVTVTQPIDLSVLRKMDEARPILVLPSHERSKPTTGDVEKLRDFVLFVGTLLLICKRLFNILDTVTSLKETSRSFAEIMRAQSLQFIRLTDELRELKLTPVGRYIFQMLSTVRDVNTLTKTEEHRMQTEFFAEFTKCRYVGVNYSNRFDGLVISVLRLIHRLSNFRQNSDVINLFSNDMRTISASYMWRFLNDLNGHINDEIMGSVFGGLNWNALEVRETIASIREEMLL